MTPKIAVLGAGFIGKNFVTKVLESGESISVLDHKECPYKLQNKLTWIQGDLGDTEVVRNVIHNVEVVYHFISNTVPGDAVDESQELAQNVLQTLQLLKICADNKVRRVIFISSSSVYGIQHTLPIPEMALPQPISSHGIHKLTIEMYLQLYRHHHKLDCKIIRLSNPYGPGQNILGRQGFIAIVIGKILAGEPIMIRGDGSIIRDYVYIDDVTEILIKIGQCKTHENVFNAGSGCGYSLNQIIMIMSNLISEPIRVEYTDSRFIDIPASILNVSRAASILGKTHTTSIKAGLTKTLLFHGLSVAT